MTYEDCLRFMGTKRRKRIWHYTYITKENNYFRFQWGSSFEGTFLYLFYDGVVGYRARWRTVGIKTRLNRFGQHEFKFQRSNIYFKLQRDIYVWTHIDANKLFIKDGQILEDIEYYCNKIEG